MSGYQAVLVAAAVVTGMAGGVLYAFSAFVMAGIREQPAAAAAATMQAINRHAMRWPLGVLLLATLAVPAVAGVMAIAGDHAGRGWVIAGTATTLVGVLAVTAAGNVPLNERLARTNDPVAVWASFVQPWLAWNHVRAAAGAVASALFAVGLFVSAS